MVQQLFHLLAAFSKHRKGHQVHTSEQEGVLPAVGHCFTHAGGFAGLEGPHEHVFWFLILQHVQVSVCDEQRAAYCQPIA